MNHARLITAELARIRGWDCFLQGDWEQARHNLANALQIFTEVGHLHRRPLLLERLALASQMAGRSTEAARFAEDLLAETAADTDPRWGLKARGLLAAVSTSHVAPAEAAENYRQILLALGDPVDLPGRVLRCFLLTSLGHALGEAGQFGDAEHAHTRAHHVATQLGLRLMMALCAAEIATAANTVGHPERALEWADAAVRSLPPGANSVLTAAVFRRFAQALSHVGLHAQAEEALMHALAAARETPLLDLELRYVGVELALRANQYEEGEARATELLARIPDSAAHIRPEVLNARGLLRLQECRHAEALPDLTAALRLKDNADHLGLATSHHNLARAYVMAGDTEAARSHANLAEQLRTPLLKTGGDEAGAIGLFNTGAAAVFQIQQELALAADDAAKALAAAERGRSGPLSTSIRAARAGRGRVPDNPPDLERIQQLARRVGATLLVYAPHFTFGAVDEQHPPVRELHIWLVTDRAVHHRAVRTRLSSSLARGHHDEIASAQELGRIANEPHALAEWAATLIAPIAALLPSGPRARLVIVPQLNLWHIPFTALPISGDQTLGDLCSIAVVPSLHALELITAEDAWGASEDAASQALVVGGVEGAVVPLPDGEVLALEDDPVTDQTAIEIASMYGTTALTREAATVNNVRKRMPNADILHFSCHAVRDARPRLDQPPGAVALTPASDGADQGQLTTTTLATTPTSARLAVLACCATARGLVTADGVVGPARALLASGVSTVIATLWEVPPGPTHDVMVRFHQEVRASGDPADALRRAVVAAREQWVLPEIWAAFVLIGSPGATRGLLK
ncbi:CHAT domain-containing protein [Streptomyces mirabilis]|uniref:CHAT domain-containing protein n=1 Tax=Streptomyces mirabilis TaxID=68239 RepID=UPI00368EA191